MVDLSIQSLPLGTSFVNLYAPIAIFKRTLIFAVNDISYNHFCINNKSYWFSNLSIRHIDISNKATGGQNANSSFNDLVEKHQQLDH